MSIILTRRKLLEDRVSEVGRVHENTLELIDVFIALDITGVDLSAEEAAVQKYYGLDKFLEKLKEEQDHYDQLRSSLIHRLKFIQYFFKQGPENRKAIIFSDDCISLLHYLKRGRDTLLNVYMRSSDIKSLFPLDTLYLCKILREVNDRVCPPELRDNLREAISIRIGSAHIYISGGRD